MRWLWRRRAGGALRGGRWLADNGLGRQSTPGGKEHRLTDSLCDYNSETTPANNLVCRAEEKTDVSEHEWKGKRKNARHGSS